GAVNVKFEQLRPNYNVAPTTDIPVVVEHYQQPQDTTSLWERNLYLARWGLVPFWAKDLAFGQQAFNARSETVVTKPTFRAAVRSRRAAIPVDGYYEWLAPQRKGQPKQPYYIRPKTAHLSFSPAFMSGGKTLQLPTTPNGYCLPRCLPVLRHNPVHSHRFWMNCPCCIIDCRCR